MNKPIRFLTISMLSMAVCGVVSADNRTGPGGGVGTTNTPDSTAGNANTAGNSNTTGTNAGGMQGRGGDMNAQGGQAADQQVMQVFQQIRQEPDKAADRLFALSAAMDDRWEIEFARVAETKSQDPQIKELARMIRQDHEQHIQQVQQWAQQNGMQLPQGLPSEKQQKLAVLSALPAEQFDTCFVVDNKADHAKAITSYRDHAKTLKDDQLKQLAQQTIPKLEQLGAHIVQVAQAKNYGDTSFALGTSGQRMGDHDRMGNTGNRSGTGTGSSAGTGSGSGTGTGAGTGTGGSGTNSGTAGANDNP